MIVIPKWLETVPEPLRALTKQRFLLRICALYATERGQMGELSTLLGYGVSSIGNYTMRNAELLPIQVVIRIEQLLGRDIVTREELRPDIFDHTLPASVS